VATLQGAVPLRPALIAAAMARGSLAFGELSHPVEMLQAGGPVGLRAYAAADLLARTVAFGRAELRQTFGWNADSRVAYLASLRGFGMAAFWEGALVGSCEAPLRHQAFQDAGVTLRALFDWMGLAPSTLELDLAWALDRRARSCLGRTVAAGGPAGHPTVLVRFGPSF
jgi:hypothetical protein